MASQSALRLLIDLYIDENVSDLIARIFIERGYDVISAKMAGMLGASDERQLACAVSQKREIVTHNRDDYSKLHQEYVNQHRLHYGIIISKVRRPMDVANRLQKTLDQFTADEMEMRILLL